VDDELEGGDGHDVTVGPAARLRVRSGAIAVVVLLVVIVAAVAATRSPSQDATAVSADPAGTLDAALEASEPAYVFIHSLT
jgi:hypothetical protein